MQFTPEDIARMLDEEATMAPSPAVAGAEQAVGLDGSNELTANSAVERQNDLAEKQRQEQKKKLDPLQSKLRAKRMHQQRMFQKSTMDQKDLMNAQNDYMDATVKAISQML